MYSLSPNYPSSLPSPEEALIEAEESAESARVPNAKPENENAARAEPPRRLISGTIFALEEIGATARSEAERVQLQRLLAAHLGETSQTDLAAHLGVTQQAVSLRLQRALNTLRWAATLESWPACPSRMRRDLGESLGATEVEVSIAYWDARFCATRTARCMQRPRDYVVDRLRVVRVRLATMPDDRIAGPYARDLDRVRARYARSET